MDRGSSTIETEDITKGNGRTTRWMDMVDSSTNLESLLMMGSGTRTSSTAEERSTTIILMFLQDRLITAISESRTNTGSITKVFLHAFRRYLLRCQTRPRKIDLPEWGKLRGRVQIGSTSRPRAFPPGQQGSDPRSMGLGEIGQANLIILMIEYHFYCILVAIIR